MGSEEGDLTVYGVKKVVFVEKVGSEEDCLPVCGVNKGDFCGRSGLWRG